MCGGGSSTNLIKSALPFMASGKIVKGFGRGSKELGIPTANFDEEVVDGLPAEISTGIYFGWAKLDNDPVEKMVMSIGWNPYYKNTKRSMETHILKKYSEDLYDRHLRVIITGYIRPEKNYDSLDELIKAINNDIKFANETLENDSTMIKLKNHEFLRDMTQPSSNL